MKILLFLSTFFLVTSSLHADDIEAPANLSVATLCKTFQTVRANYWKNYNLSIQIQAEQKLTEQEKAMDDFQKSQNANARELLKKVLVKQMEILKQMGGAEALLKEASKNFNGLQLAVDGVKSADVCNETDRAIDTFGKIKILSPECLKNRSVQRAIVTYQQLSGLELMGKVNVQVEKSLAIEMPGFKFNAASQSFTVPVNHPDTTKNLRLVIYLDVPVVSTERAAQKISITNLELKARLVHIIGINDPMVAFSLDGRYDYKVEINSSVVSTVPSSKTPRSFQEYVLESGKLKDESGKIRDDFSVEACDATTAADEKQRDNFQRAFKNAPSGSAH